MTTRYENEGIDSSISFEQPLLASREELRDLLFYIVENNKNLRLPIQGITTINRIKKELNIEE